MNALGESNVPVTNPAMFWDNKPTIDIAYNHKDSDGYNHIDVSYHLVYENVEYG
jgi:hypothetical protein